MNDLTPTNPKKAPWVDHTGAELPETLSFFVTPDPLIGEIISADTDLKKENKKILLDFELQERHSFLKKNTLLYWTIAVLLFIPTLLLLQSKISSTLFWGFLFGSPIFFFALSLGIAYILFKPTKHCSFIGKAGLQHSSLSWNKKIKTQIVRFSDIKKLTIERIRSIEKHSPNQGMLRYAFWGHQGTLLFLIEGKESITDTKEPLLTDPLLFAQRAEQIWTQQRVESAEEEIRQRGITWFEVSENIQFGIGINQLALLINKHQKTFFPEQIIDLSIHIGTLAITIVNSEQNTPRFSYYPFDISEIGDFSAFLLCIRRYLGKTPNFMRYPMFNSFESSEALQ